MGNHTISIYFETFISSFNNFINFHSSWRRETIVKEVYKNGIKGDVIYYSPCSKKLRTFQEIERVSFLESKIRF